MISKKNNRKIKNKSSKRQKGGNNYRKTEKLVKMLCKKAELYEISEYLSELKQKNPEYYQKLINHIANEIKYIDIEIGKSNIKKEHLEKLIDSIESNLVMRGGGIGIMILVILLVLIAYLFYKYNLLDVYKEVMKAKGSPIKMALLATKFLSGKLFKPKN
jgi:membrane protein insertase Oxa1/YidC/SpoIIIJ